MISFTRGNQRFEIRREEGGCAGYVDGVLSATGPNAPTVAQVLIMKHIRGVTGAIILPVVAMQPALAVEHESVDEPDLSG